MCDHSEEEQHHAINAQLLCPLCMERKVQQAYLKGKLEGIQEASEFIAPFNFTLAEMVRVHAEEITNSKQSVDSRNKRT